ncbi:MAG TPA: hypothetical protein VHF22_13770, partial [Planctomycetota bacterium]|nr:hypothetical protein [Planctomycetota bacterium]
RPGWLVLDDSCDPLWRATVNGAAAPVLPADHALRAVALRAGASRVELRYVSWPLRAGLALAAAGLAALLGLSARARRGPRGAS